MNLAEQEQSGTKGGRWEDRRLDTSEEGAALGEREEDTENKKTFGENELLGGKGGNLDSKGVKVGESKMQKFANSKERSSVTVVERERRQALSSSSLPEAEPTEELLVEEPKKGPR